MLALLRRRDVSHDCRRDGRQAFTLACGRLSCNRPGQKGRCWRPGGRRRMRVAWWPDGVMAHLPMDPRAGYRADRPAPRRRRGRICPPSHPTMRIDHPHQRSVLGRTTRQPCKSQAAHMSQPAPEFLATPGDRLEIAGRQLRFERAIPCFDPGSRECRRPGMDMHCQPVSREGDLLVLGLECRGRVTALDSGSRQSGSWVAPPPA